MIAHYDEETRVCVLDTDLTFDDDHKEYTLYAIFENHPYNVRFYDIDGTTLLATTYSTYGQPAKDPGIVPSTDESGLEIDETYAFKGYSATLIAMNQLTDKVIANNKVTLNNITVTKDLNFYAMYKK
jgi:hypothetical protein